MQHKVGVSRGNARQLGKRGAKRQEERPTKKTKRASDTGVVGKTTWGFSNERKTLGF
jgi:hypothetical protein